MRAVVLRKPVRQRQQTLRGRLKRLHLGDDLALARPAARRPPPSACERRGRRNVDAEAPSLSSSCVAGQGPRQGTLISVLHGPDRPIGDSRGCSKVPRSNSGSGSHAPRKLPTSTPTTRQYAIVSSAVGRPRRLATQDDEAEARRVPRRAPNKKRSTYRANTGEYPQCIDRFIRSGSTQRRLATQDDEAEARRVPRRAPNKKRSTYRANTGEYPQCIDRFIRSGSPQRRLATQDDGSECASLGPLP